MISTTATRPVALELLLLLTVAQVVVVLLPVVFSPVVFVDGLSSSTTVADSVAQSAYRLKEALYSPSGKLTLSPEIVVPEPDDPTALLLQASYVTKLSTDLRTKAKANAAFVSGTLESVRQITTEQEDARGSFPGPLPVIYCPPSSFLNSDSDDDDDVYEEISDAGSCAILYGVGSGKAIASVADLQQEVAAAAATTTGGKDNGAGWMKKALAQGLQPIPEVTLSMETTWTEQDVMDITDLLKEQCGGGSTTAPVCVVLSMDAPEEDEENNEEGFLARWWENVPTLSKSFVSDTPVLGSVRIGDQEGLRDYNDRLKSKGFAGAFLRADCVPGFRLNPDLEFVAKFWTAVVANLKSTRSKAFQGFRTKTALEKDVPMEWMKYQQDVMASGALGESSTQADLADLDLDKGDHKGF